MGQYQTHKTSLAAFLAVSGIKLIKLDTSIDPAEFIFESPDGKIDKLLFDWDSGIATGNVVAFYKTYKSFVNQINTAKGRAR